MGLLLIGLAMIHKLGVAAGVNQQIPYEYPRRAGVTLLWQVNFRSVASLREFATKAHRHSPNAHGRTDHRAEA